MRYVKTELCTIAGNKGRHFLIVTRAGNQLQSPGLLKLDVELTKTEHASYVARFRPKTGHTNTVAGLRVSYLGPTGKSHIRVLVSADEAYRLYETDSIDDVMTLIEHGIGCAL